MSVRLVLPCGHQTLIATRWGLPCAECPGPKEVAFPDFDGTPRTAKRIMVSGRRTWGVEI